MTLDTARMLANVNERAQTLFQCGYRAVPGEDWDVEVSNDEGTTYTVNTLFECCTCPFYTRHEGKYPCKHVLGVARLLKLQELASRNWRDVIGLPVTITDATHPQARLGVDSRIETPCLVLEIVNGSVWVLRNDTGLPWVDGWCDGDSVLRTMINTMIEEVTHAP